MGDRPSSHSSMGTLGYGCGAPSGLPLARPSSVPSFFPLDSLRSPSILATNRTPILRAFPVPVHGRPPMLPLVHARVRVRPGPGAAGAGLERASEERLGMPYQMDYLKPAPLDPRAEQVMVPMRDGVRLATDVYLPAGPGRLPAVLVRLPYDKCGRYTFMPQLRARTSPSAATRSSCRTCAASSAPRARRMPFVHEVDDGYDTLEWIVAQPWSNGRVGMFGDSYYGYTQWAAVASGHPGAQGDRAARDRAPTSGCSRATGGATASCRCTAPTTWRTTGPTSCIYDFYAADCGHRPLAEVFDEGFAAIGTRSASFDLMLAHDRTGGHRRSTRPATPSTSSRSRRCTRSAGSTTSRRTR